MTDTTIYYASSTDFTMMPFRKVIFNCFQYIYRHRRLKALNLSLNSRCVYLLFVNILWSGCPSEVSDCYLLCGARVPHEDGHGRHDAQVYEQELWVTQVCVALWGRGEHNY